MHELAVTVKNFVLSKLESPWRVLNRSIKISDLPLKRAILAITCIGVIICLHKIQ